MSFTNAVNPLVSFVIPCYNHGAFIQEALDSIAEIRDLQYEVIIVNDGSTDEATLVKLVELETQGYIVISQHNSGPAHTRNKGIEASKGIYIVPLDADNKIKPAYVYKALPLLQHDGYDIVYAKPLIFGDTDLARSFTTREFNIIDLSIQNYIDTCAVFKKSVWADVGGYDGDMPFIGQEDWEFWIHAYIKGHKFYFLDEELFYYRVVATSVTAVTAADNKLSSNHRYMVQKHPGFFSKIYQQLYYDHRSHEKDVAHPFRSFLKYLYHNYFRKQGVQ